MMHYFSFLGRKNKNVWRTRNQVCIMSKLTRAACWIFLHFSSGLFLFLHKSNWPWRRAMSSLRLLALRWSMTTPYWCTLAPFRILPAAADDQSARRASPLSPGAARLLHLFPQPRTLAGRPGMFQRFASALFGDDMEEMSRCSRPGDGKEEEEDEDWILVNYLGKSHMRIWRITHTCVSVARPRF